MNLIDIILSYGGSVNYVNTALDNYVGWDEDTYTLTFKSPTGKTLTIDLPLESLAEDIDYDPETKEIIIYKHDGTEIRISIYDLVDVYTGYEGDQITTEIIDEDDSLKIKATINPGSITEDELAESLLNIIDEKLSIVDFNASLQIGTF